MISVSSADAQIVDLLHHLAYLVVNPANEASLNLVKVTPTRLVGILLIETAWVGFRLGQGALAVRRRPSPVRKERLLCFGFAIDKTLHPIEDDAMCMFARIGNQTGFGLTKIAILWNQQRLAAVIKTVGVVGVGMNLVIVTNELVETLTLGRSGRTRRAESPLAVAASRVTGAFEHLAEGNVFVKNMSRIEIASHRGSALMQPRQQRCSRRRANIRRSVSIRELYAASRQRVDIGRRNGRVGGVTSKVASPRVIDHDEDDVGLGSASRVNWQCCRQRSATNDDKGCWNACQWGWKIQFNVRQHIQSE